MSDLYDDEGVGWSEGWGVNFVWQEPSPPTPLFAAHNWPSNGALIADVARMYFPTPARVLDPTFGRGLWWTEYQPEDLVTHDIRVDGVDFRQLPEEDDSFDVVAFDPPYVCVGGRKTTTVGDLHDRYGLTDAPSSPAGVQADIDAGLSEAARVCRPGGLVLVKCQDYISSGRLWPGSFHTTAAGLALGLRLLDRVEHLSGPRPQPAHRRQVHFRRNYSTLLVFDKRGH